MWVKVKGECGEGVQLDRWLLLEQEEKEQKKAPPTGRIGGQQPSVCAGPLQLHRGDGDAFQKLMARLLALKQL